MSYFKHLNLLGSVGVVYESDAPKNIDDEEISEEEYIDTMYDFYLEQEELKPE